jgi:hypothetical protein
MLVLDRGAGMRTASVRKTEAVLSSGAPATAAVTAQVTRPMSGIATKGPTRGPPSRPGGLCLEPPGP